MNKTKLFKYKSEPAVANGVFYAKETSAYVEYEKFIQDNPNIEIISVITNNHVDIVLTYKEQPHD